MAKIIKITKLPWQRSSRWPTGRGKDHQDDQLAVAKDHQDDPRSVPLKATSSKIPWADGWIIRRWQAVGSLKDDQWSNPWKRMAGDPWEMNGVWILERWHAVWSLKDYQRSNIWKRTTDWGSLKDEWGSNSRKMTSGRILRRWPAMGNPWKMTSDWILERWREVGFLEEYQQPDPYKMTISQILQKDDQRCNLWRRTLTSCRIA